MTREEQTRATIERLARVQKAAREDEAKLLARLAKRREQRRAGRK